MNAHELANELAFKHIEGDDDGSFIVKLRDMLWKQADEIESLRQQLVKYELAEIKSLYKTKQLDEKGRPMTYWGGESFDRTASHMAGEDVSHQEPVAWMLTLPDGTHDWILDGSECEGYIPLYTHPAKTLTDEEISHTADDVDLWVPDRDMQKLFDFARAILRKAQEK